MLQSGLNACSRIMALQAWWEQVLVYVHDPLFPV